MQESARLVKSSQDDGACFSGMGFVFLGIVLPFGVITMSVLVGLQEIPTTLLYLPITSQLLWDLILRYLILKNGFYNPLVPESRSFS